jgi:hypothetical protein
LPASTCRRSATASPDIGRPSTPPTSFSTDKESAASSRSRE